MTSTFAANRENLLRYTVVFAMAAAALYFVIASWHWALLCDSPIMHYVNFLMSHGLRPYSDISDNNLPGAYLTESWAMHVFGGGDLAWRIYEFFLLGVLTVAMIVIVQPLDWVAGAYGGGMFMLLHGSEGPWYSVERDQVMTALLMIGYACLFSSVRMKKPALLLAMGFTTAMACAIKPTVLPLVLLLLVIVWGVLRRHAVSPAPFLLWALLGLCTAVAINVGFLLEHHALLDFWHTQTRFTTVYVSQNQMSNKILLLNAIPKNTLFLVLLALVLAVKNRGWDWERWTLALGAVVGLASYVLQHKGFLHHRYMFLTFLLLLAGIEFLTALRRQGWPRWFGAAALVMTVFVLVPRYMINIHRVTGNSELVPALETDLQVLGGTTGLQRQVQCLDMVYGCLNALYHLQLVENTGFTGDLLLFSPAGGPAVNYSRSRWALEAKENPAAVLVMTNEYFQGNGVNSFERINNWPEYAKYLSENYTQVVSRSFPDERGKEAAARQAELGGANAYRIYIHNGSALLTTAVQLPGLATRIDTAPTL